MSSSDEDLIICNSAFIAMCSDARRKKRKRRWWIKTLLKNVRGQLYLQTLAWKKEVGFEILQE
jgi:hypothetical protein